MRKSRRLTLRQFVDRYGVALGVVLALVVALAVVPSNVSSQRVSSGAVGGTGTDSELGLGGVDASGAPLNGAGDDAAGGLGGAGAGGGGAGNGASGGAAPAASSSDVKFGVGPDCRSDGRQKGISFYMPPCVQWTGTSNGGSTAQGVTDTRVLVVRYLPQIDPATRQILQSADLSDEPAVVKRAYTVLLRYANLHYQTYGREVVFQDYPASGPSENDSVMRSDAIDIATRIKPFAVIEGDPAGPMSVVLIQELARRGIVCMCSTTQPQQYYAQTPGKIFSSLPTSDEHIAQAAEYSCKKLKDKPAQFAGDNNYKNKTRKFGMIYLAGTRGKVSPNAALIKPIAEREFGKCGIQFAKVIQYLYDPGRNQVDVTNLIAQMKSEGITTVVPFWDPLYPILITKEATNQQYFPEWLMTGTGLSDTTSAGRLYDQAQWRHAFGISPLWVTWNTVSKSTGYRMYHHMKPSAPPGEEGVLINVYGARIMNLLDGIHMAGPKLTADTFAQGMYSIPPTGGTAAHPLVKWTQQVPTAIKDFSEAFYAADETGVDERGKRDVGLVFKANEGRRYQAGQWNTEPSAAFRLSGALATTDNPPGGGDPEHEQDGHRHPDSQRCLSCK